MTGDRVPSSPRLPARGPLIVPKSWTRLPEEWPEDE